MCLRGAFFAVDEPASSLPFSMLLANCRIPYYRSLEEGSLLEGWYNGGMGGNMLCVDCDYLCGDTCIFFVSCYESHQMAD